MRDKGYWIIWPEYFDKNRSKGEGRKVPKNLAVENPKLEEIADACKALGLEYIIERDKKYPKNWYESQGRILVKRVQGKKKKEIIKELAKYLILKRYGKI